MDTKDLKKRLRAAIATEGLTNLAIAEKTGYTPNMVSKSLNAKYSVLSTKFLTKLFEAFPEFAAKHKEQILNGATADQANLFNSPVELAELRKVVIEQKATIAELREQLNYFRGLFAQSMQLHPDLVKLIDPLAFKKFGAELPVITGNMVHKGARQGAMA